MGHGSLPLTIGKKGSGIFSDALSHRRGFSAAHEDYVLRLYIRGA